MPEHVPGRRTSGIRVPDRVLGVLHDIVIVAVCMFSLAWYEGCPSNELVERGGEERGEEGEGGRRTGPEGPCHRSVRLRATALNATRPSYNGRPQGIHSLLSKGHGSDS